ncbi:unnamed protein product [Nippostrongylus brasiliensis]|uniref:Rho GTPase activating protein at 15B (inferred by orthology to a D. melanogaster protein) n=1 Tax=Nippostrongylus brasiliensis TaxID=27835 RepID=A0A0N4Y271_NIPBR|nr:unnamed protein product [Nippostrongylus brasiliensis]
MSAKPPVPKPRTRFNVGGVYEAPSLHQVNDVSNNSSVNSCAYREMPSNGIQPIVENVVDGVSASTSLPPEKTRTNRTAPPPPPCPPPPPPAPSSCPPSTHQRPARPPPPAPGWKKRWEGSKNSAGDNQMYDSVARCSSPAAPRPRSRALDFIENPIYMSLCALKRLSMRDSKRKSESSTAVEDSSPQVDAKSCCLPNGASESNGVDENKSMANSASGLSLLSDPSCGLESALPVPRQSSSSPGDHCEDRSTTSSLENMIAPPAVFDELDKVVEVAEVPEIAASTIELVNLDNESSTGDEFSSTTVAFFGDVLLHVGKKERKSAHARLRHMKLSFHDDDATEECIAGPFCLLGCELICREENTITLRLNERESVKTVVFSTENNADTWMLLLGECWLSEYDLLKSSVQQIDACGTFWLRQGATSEWMYTAAAIHGRTMFYVLLDSPDYIYELDVRKVLLLRERIDKADWCPNCKKKEQKGPFLISLEGCALYLECCDDMCTTKWFAAIQDALALPPAMLEDFRLTADNIPIIVDKCLRFVAAYGIRSEGIYRRNGKISEAKEIFKGLSEDPVRTHIASSSEETVYAVADVLRQFFRHLKSPLFPTEIHKEIFSIVASRALSGNEKRYEEYRRVLQKMPLVHYHTLRKLIAHLSEVVKYKDVNKASVENVAKVFGPSLFHKNGDDNAGYIDCTDQIGAIIDLINGYDVIFEIDLAAEEVCCKAIARRGFDAPQDGNYAIFEIIIDGTLSRRLPKFEKLSVSVLDHWLTWQCTDGFLLFDHDNWPYNGAETDFFSGKVKIAEPGSKSFHSYDISVDGGVKIVAYKHDKIWKEWIVAESVFYSGCAASRKAPNAHNLTILDKKTTNVADKFVGFCMSFRLMPEKTRFLNTIEFIETGTFVMIRSVLPSVRVARLLCTEAVASSSYVEEKPLKKVGRALETYLRLSKEHVSMMARERADFELGRRHLANMMNLDVHTMTQEDIDRAIQYLFPSSLFDLKARPVMRPPDEILPK